MPRRCLVLVLAAIPALAVAQVSFVDIASGDLTVPVASWGASFVDVDRDGDPDLFVSRFAATGGNALYRNDGGVFTAIDAGPLTSGPGSIGHAWADADNDGDLDVLLVGGTGSQGPGTFGDTGGGIRLLLNDGDGTSFTPSRDAPFQATPEVQGWTGAWADVDLDGRLDFVVAHPASFVSAPSQPNALYRQVGTEEGGPRFEAVADSPVTTGLDAYTVATFSDYDLDGDPDLFIGSGPADNTVDEDNLYRNEGGSFVRITEGVIATDERDGQVMNWQDIDNDGDLDLFVTSFNGGSATAGRDDLYRNNGDDTFTSVTDDALVTDVTGFSLANTWGDVDNDGDLDVFVTATRPGQHPSLGQNRLHLNDGAGRFTRVWTTDQARSAGATFADIDDDGDLDLAVTSQVAAPIRLYENQAPAGNAWVKLRLTGRASNRSAVGARVEVTATINGRSVTQLREVSTQNTFNGHNDLVVHVGLGDATTIDRLRVVWPSGHVDTDEGLAARTTYDLEEGVGTASEGGVETGGLRLGPPVPNPSASGVALALAIPVASPVEVDVFDLAGRHLAILQRGALGAGETAVQWDGRDDTGASVAAGVYVVRVRAAGGEARQRVTVVR